MRTRPRPDRRFAGGLTPAWSETLGRFGSSAPIVLPERARPRVAPSPTRSELEELGRQTASVAHDFNNLLAVIMVCAGEIAAGPADGSHRDRAIEISEAAERGAALSRRLLSGRGPETEPEQRPAPIAVERAIAGSMNLIERALGTGIRLSLETGDHLPPVLLAPGEIERILLNLASNSRDAMPAGGSIRIRVELISVPIGDPALGTGWHVRIAFTDSGVGMSPEVAQQAVDPYFSTKDHGDGTGLGLASVRAAARSSGGDLRIDSRLGAGTTVAIYLPALDASGGRLAMSTPSVCR